MIDFQSTARFSLFDGHVSAYLFGADTGKDWNIVSNPLAPWDVAQFCDSIGVHRIWAPRPAEFNAHICTNEALGELIQLGNVQMHRGCNADGTFVPAGEAFWLSSADCITIVVQNPATGVTIAAHAGRDCLVDKGRINHGHTRCSESVVHAILAQFPKSVWKYLRVFLTCGIGPENFDHPCDHPTYGASNTKMVFDILAKWGANGKVLHGDHFAGKICLSELIRSQFITVGGLQPHLIGYDGVDTYAAKCRAGYPLWWSHRRGDGAKRNGVLIVRNW